MCTSILKAMQVSGQEPEQDYTGRSERSLLCTMQFVSLRFSLSLSLAFHVRKVTQVTDLLFPFPYEGLSNPSNPGGCLAVRHNPTRSQAGLTTKRYRSAEGASHNAAISTVIYNLTTSSPHLIRPSRRQHILQNAGIIPNYYNPENHNRNIHRRQISKFTLSGNGQSVLYTIHTGTEIKSNIVVCFPICSSSHLLYRFLTLLLHFLLLLRPDPQARIQSSRATEPMPLS